MNFINNYAIDAYTLNGKFVGNFPSIAEAVRALKLRNHGNIASCLAGKRNYAEGYVWKHSPIEVPILEGEQWKPVVGFENLYAVSNYGRVASLQFHGKESFSILSQINGKLNYKFAKIRDWKKGYVRSYPIHRMVAEAFIPNPENKPQVDHIDTNPSNNNVTNLRWVTSLENQRNPLTLERLQKSIIALNKNKVGPMAFAAKNRKVVLYNDGQCIVEYPSLTDAAKDKKLNLPSISRWCRQNKYGWSFK